jgi:hypothetical protein
MRERVLMVGRGHYVGFGKWVMGWVNEPGPVRNENRISDFSLIFFVNIETGIK